MTDAVLKLGQKVPEFELATYDPVKANVYMTRKSNEVCPSKWREEGDKTLVNPGAQMVGRVHEALVGAL